MKKTLAVLALAGVAALSACGIKDVARAVRVGAELAAQEFEEDVKSGDLSEAEGKRLTAWAEESGAAGGRLEQTAAGWGRMTPAQKRVAVAAFVDETAEAQTRLDARGAPVFKSEKARRRYAEVRKRIRQARTALREYAPPKPAPSPTPES